MSNLLLSVAYGPSALGESYLNTLRSYAEAARPFGCRFALLGAALPSDDLYDACRQYGVDLYDISGPYDNGLAADWLASGERLRHYVYAHFCQQQDADWIMTIDAKDTLFQGNPFDARWLNERKVSVSAECSTVWDCPWNKNECNGLAVGLRPEAPVMTGTWPVINGGFAVGRPDQMALFELARFGLDVKLPVHSDQASVTYLANATDVLNIVPPEVPWVCHATWHRGRPYGDYALFHQWDRLKYPSGTIEHVAAEQETTASTG